MFSVDWRCKQTIYRMTGLYKPAVRPVQQKNNFVIERISFAWFLWIFVTSQSNVDLGRRDSIWQLTCLRAYIPIDAILTKCFDFQSMIVWQRDGFNFAIVNFPYICSNIPLSPAYGVYISQLIRYAKACSTYHHFLSWDRLLADKLMLQGFLHSHLMSAFRKFYDRYNDLIYMYNYKLSLSHMLSDIFHGNSYAVLGTLTLAEDNSTFMIMELGSRRVLTLLGTWPHFWCFHGSVLAWLFLSRHRFWPRVFSVYLILTHWLWLRVLI
jgi:hypothetical protein